MAGNGPSFSQSQSLSQQQKLSPQMQQSLQVLQVPTLELRNLIQQELSENPVLEDETQEISLDEQREEDEKFDKEVEQLTQLDEEWRDYMAQARMNAPRTSEQDEARQFLFDSLVDPITLQEHLMNQVGVSDVTPAQRELAEMLIGNIDERGFLTTPISELSLSENLPLAELQNAKDLIQTFDPVGIGAEDLRECLMVQLQRLGKEVSIEFRIVSGHLDDLARKRFPQIARKLSITTEQVARAAEFIATLNPRPGRAFSQSADQYITPDVSVERDNGEYVVHLNNEQVPRLRISNVYKDILADGGGTEARSYIRDKIRSGQFLIKSIHQRQDTIRKIAEEIVSRQRDFLDAGTAHLRPMNMAQIAEIVGVHETTVSRAVSGKYIATPQGVYEMKYFFTSGYQTDSGESLSNTSVKGAIAEVVKEEDTAKPLSDVQIVEKLTEQGIKIARRTVAKYREELNILPSHLRKTF